MVPRRAQPPPPVPKEARFGLFSLLLEKKRKKLFEIVNSELPGPLSPKEGEGNGGFEGCDQVQL